MAKYKEEVEEIVGSGYLRMWLQQKGVSTRAIDYIIDAVSEKLEA